MSTTGSGAHQTAGSGRIDVDVLRRDHPIADVVASYGIELRCRGATLVGRCPFHLDQGRPNMTVYPRSGRFVCFRCQAYGDAIAFVQQFEHLSFRDAAARLGAPLEVRRLPAGSGRTLPRPARRAAARTAIEVQVLAAAVELYTNRLLGDRAALAYLAARGFGPDLLERERIGYAAGDELTAYLVWRSLPVMAARRVGLLRADGSETLAGRVVFPEIRHGRPVWLIGRLLDAEQPGPKYLGLPGTKPLLGWDDARRDLRGACVVEGPLDRLALRQWGVPGLALCGTRLHPETLALLGRWERLYAVLDADAAGREATARLIEALGSRIVPVILPGDIKDPAELAVRHDGARLFAHAIRTAIAPRMEARHARIGAARRRAA